MVSVKLPVTRLKSVANHYFFNRAGFRVYGVNASIDDNCMIDIIGPPGVGKSWLIKQLASNGMVSKKESAFHKVLTESPFHASLLKLSSDDKLDLDVLRKKAGKLLYDLNVSHSPGIYLIDEGVSHHFASELVRLHSNSRDEFLSLVSKRAVINLSASPTLIVDRIESRAAQLGYIAGCQRGLGRKELIDFTAEALRVRHQLCSLLSMEHRPVLELEMLEDSCLSGLVDKVEQFIVRVSICPHGLRQSVEHYPIV